MKFLCGFLIALLIVGCGAMPQQSKGREGTAEEVFCFKTLMNTPGYRHSSFLTFSGGAPNYDFYAIRECKEQMLAAKEYMQQKNR